MVPFYFHQITGKDAFLTGDEARHCMKVMRNKAGDRVVGIDGNGNMYSCIIAEITKREVRLDIVEKTENWGEKEQQVTLLVSPLHKADRFEWLIEKAVELGVTRIIPYLGKHTVKTGMRSERLERIMQSALKQSLRSRMPALEELCLLEDALALIGETPLVMAHGGAERHIADMSAEIRAAKQLALLVGPEGDFAEEELEAALAQGAHLVSLGTNRLRSETAAIHLLGAIKVFMGY